MPHNANHDKMRKEADSMGMKTKDESMEPMMRPQSEGGPLVSKADQMKALDAHTQRPAAAKRTDDGKLGEITLDPETFASDPERFDFPGLDTPSSFDYEIIG